MENKKELVMNRSFEFTEKPPFPRNVLVGLTTACNHGCIMCAHRLNPRKRIDINPDLVNRLITEAHSLGAEEIGFYLTGEPFLNRNFESYVKLSKETGYGYIYTTTNGVFATEERLRTLFHEGLNSIKFSVNAGNSKTYEKIHGKNDFERVMQNIRTA